MTKCVATAFTRNSGSSGRSRDTVWSMTASSSEGANSAYIVIYSPKTAPVLSRVRSPGRPYHGRCRIDTKDQIGNEQDESSTKRAACRGSRDNRQSATVSSTTCFSGVPSTVREFPKSAGSRRRRALLRWVQIALKLASLLGNGYRIAGYRLAES